MNKFYFNLPISVSTWHVEYKPFPFLKSIKCKNYLAYDYINNITSFLDIDYKNYLNPKYYNTLQHVEEGEENYGKELLRNYYLYKKKSWKYPDIQKVDVEKVYLPYQFDLITNELFEETSGKKKVLKTNEKLFRAITKELNLQ